MAAKSDGANDHGAAGRSRTLSQRLMRALTGEVRALERAISPKVVADPQAVSLAAGAKVRVEAIGNLTKTLEKLLELTRVESAASKGRIEEEGEAERLRAELMKRLRAIDARRQDGRRLFADLGPNPQLA